MIVTALQLDARELPKPQALEQVASLLNQAAGSDLVLLPELWPTGYFSFDRYPADAESLEGPLVKNLRDLARKHRFHLFTGSFVEADAGRLYNTSLLLDPQGQILGRYRKMHLFGFQSQEQQLLSPGTDITVLSTPWGRAGLSTCYDLRFPELYRAMLERGADMFLVTAAWPKARAEAWTLFQRARAHENLAHLFSCNFAGECRGLTLAGQSLFVDPTGALLADAGAAPTLLRREIDPARALATRQSFSALNDRVLRHPPMEKQHLEFLALDMATAWETPPGYPPGIQQKILSGHLDEKARTGSRSRILRFAPGTFTTAPFEHDYWEEVFLFSGSLTVANQTFNPPTYACRPPHIPHGPFHSTDGCLLFELHYFNP